MQKERGVRGDGADIYAGLYTKKRSIDKRDHQRIRTSKLTVEFKVKGSESVNKVDVVNVAAGGICFLRNSIVSKGDILAIKFPFKFTKILMNGEIIRLDGREVAVKFLNSEDEIKRYVEAFNEEYPTIEKEASKKDSILRLPDDH